MTAGERAFAWAIAIALTVQFAVPVVRSVFSPDAGMVVAGLVGVGLVAALGHGYAGGGVVGSALLGASPFAGAFGRVSVAATTLPLGYGRVGGVALGLIAGTILGMFGFLLGRGVRLVAPPDGGSSKPGAGEASSTNRGT